MSHFNQPSMTIKEVILLAIPPQMDFSLPLIPLSTALLFLQVRFHRTIKEEFYDIAFRKKVYGSLDDLQADLDQWMAYYNAERPHSGKYCDGRTPNQTFSETRHLADEKMIDTLFPEGGGSTRF